MKNIQVHNNAKWSEKQMNVAIGGKGMHARRNGLISESTVFSQFFVSAPGTFGGYCSLGLEQLLKANKLLRN